MRTWFLLFMFVSSCTTTQRYPFLPYNCEGIEGWILDAQLAGADPHVITLKRGVAGENEILFFADLAVQDGFSSFVGDRYHAIAQQTHYKSFSDYVRGAAACFNASVTKTTYGLKAFATIDQSSLIIESSNRCEEQDFFGECKVVAMTYIPPAVR